MQNPTTIEGDMMSSSKAPPGDLMSALEALGVPVYRVELPPCSPEVAKAAGLRAAAQKPQRRK
jgi:hypothetical protein